MRGTALAAVPVLVLGAWALAGCVIGYDVDYAFAVRTDADVRSGSEVSLRWTVDERTLELEVENRGMEPITLHWEEAVFRDEEGGAHELIVAERRYGAYTRGTPTRVPATSRVAQFVWPVDYAHLDLRSTIPDTHWVASRPLLPVVGGPDRVALREHAARYLGANLAVELPVTSDEETIRYRFVFEVVDVVVRKARDIF